jgi:hypothetical protein
LRSFRVSEHLINLEEPEAFPRALHEFFHMAEQGRWDECDPRLVTLGIAGLRRSQEAKT